MNKKNLLFFVGLVVTLVAVSAFLKPEVIEAQGNTVKPRVKVNRGGSSDVERFGNGRLIPFRAVK